MRRIEVDDEVYRYLESRAKGFEQPNDVLRRELALPAAGSSAERGRLVLAHGGRPGDLKPFLDQGLMAPGDRLLYIQKRKGLTFEGRVAEDGWIEVRTAQEAPVQRFREPSPALGLLVGTSISGWANWTHEPSGRTLKDLRDSRAPAG